MSFPQLRSKLVNQLTNATAAVAYTLAAAAGSYAVTGTDATLKAGYALQVDSGNIAVTGTAVTLNKGFTLSGGSGSYVVTGTDGNFAVTLSTDSGAYDWTGSATTLTYNSLSADLAVNHDWQREYPRAFQRSLYGKRGFNFVNEYATTATSGSYTVVGTDAGFATTQVGQWINQRDAKKRAWPRPFAPSPWGHFTNQRSTNRLSYATQSYALISSNGSYTVTGTAASLLEGHILSATAGAVDWNVFAVNLNRGRTLVSDVGSFVFTSPSANFTIVMPATSGSWVWTGSSSAGATQHFITASDGSYVITGTNAALISSKAAFPGSYTWTGSIATLRYSGELFSGRGGILLLGAG